MEVYEFQHLRFIVILINILLDHLKIPAELNIIISCDIINKIFL